MSVQSVLLSQITGIEHAFEFPGAPQPLLCVHQIHGREIVDADRDHRVRIADIKADGLVTTGRDAIGVQTADCIPALFSAGDGSRVAAVHAGWRGVLAGIFPEAVTKFRDEAVEPEQLFVALGPSIRSCCFEVSEEVTAAFAREWPQSERFAHGRDSLAPELLTKRAAPARESGVFFDLCALARQQLEAAGVPPVQIDDVGMCTYCGAGLPDLAPNESVPWASYRRATHAEPELTAGRQWSWIRLSAPLPTLRAAAT